MLGFFSDDPDAGFHDVCDHVIIFFRTFRGLTLILLGLLHWQFLIILVLQEKDGVVKGLAAIRRHLSPIPSRYSQLREGVSFPPLLNILIDVGLGLVCEHGKVVCGNFMCLMGGGHEAA